MTMINRVMLTRSQNKISLFWNKFNLLLQRNFINQRFQVTRQSKMFQWFSGVFKTFIGSGFHRHAKVFYTWRMKSAIKIKGKAERGEKQRIVSNNKRKAVQVCQGLNGERVCSLQSLFSIFNLLRMFRESDIIRHDKNTRRRKIAVRTYRNCGQ